MTDIERAINAQGPLEHQQLSDLARFGIRESVRHVPEDLNETALFSLWPKLVESAHSNNVGEKYLTTSCNAISVFLTVLLKSDFEPLCTFVASREVWQQGYDCAQYAFACGKTKPALQVLESLAHVLNEHSDKQIAREQLQQTSETIIGTIFTDQPRGTMKASCISLSCLLRKTSLHVPIAEAVQGSLDRHVSDWQKRRYQVGLPHIEGRNTFTSLQELLLALLFAINNLETRSASLKLFTQLCGHSGAQPLEQAAEVLEYYIQENKGVLGDFSANVLPVLLDSKSAFEAFISLYKPSSDPVGAKLYLFLTVLKVGRMKDFITEDGLPDLLNAGFAASDTVQTVIDRGYECFDALLQAGDAETRIHAYSLLTASFATKASIPITVLKCLLRNFRYLHDDNDAHERGELISTTRRFLKRLDSSYLSLQKLQQTGKASKDDLDGIKEYENFIEAILEVTSSELEVGVSYQRHIIALGNIQLLLSTSFNNWFGNNTLMTRLVCLVIDPYDDVRAISSAVLATMKAKNAKSLEALEKQLLTKILSLSAQTCRHDHADAAGRLIALLNRDSGAQLSNGTASDNELVFASDHTILRELQYHLSELKALRPKTSFPLHALILSLAHNYATDLASSEVAGAVLAICNSIWRLVQPELCIDSPETGTEDSDELNIGGPKDQLAYAWRALRDSSLLLQAIMRTNKHYLSEIGSICIEELIMLRHRGAFSTVAQTFAMCCDEARSNRDASVRSLLRIWYNSALLQIDEQASKVTRRSAGLPAMFNAILSSQDEPFFHEAVMTLKQRAAQAVDAECSLLPEKSLPQVHALNCIKDLITNSKFRAVSEQFILELIELAADRMSSSVWAIRNCGLMLLRACMNRLDPKMINSSDILRSGEEIVSGPVRVALSLLQRTAGPVVEVGDDSVQRSEKIFAALDLVRHIGTSKGIDDPFQAFIHAHLGSSIWAIRQHAANVLAARMTTFHDWPYIFGQIALTEEATENEAHGLLLFHRAAFQTWEAQADHDAFLASTPLITDFIGIVAGRLRTKSSSPLVQGAAVDFANDCLQAALVRGFPTPAVLECTKTLLSQISISEPYCRQRGLLCSVLRSLGAIEEVNFHAEILVNEFRTVATAEDLAHVAETLQSLIQAQKSIVQQKKLLQILVLLVESSCRPNAQLLMSITSLLESGCLEINHNDSDRLRQAFNTKASRDDRDLWNANIRLRAHMLNADSKNRSLSLESVEAWLRDVGVANKDELELPTRLNAAQAVLCFVRDHDDALKAFLELHQSLDIRLLLIVYDQLNDDDEDIRQIAQHTVQSLIRRPDRTVDVRPCALSAREALLRSITGKFSQNSTVPQAAAARIVGGEHSSSGQHVGFKRAVKARLADMIASMNDLFAEEKQNLYIDELDEIRKWSSVLSSFSIDTMPTQVRQEAISWTVEGLQALTDALFKVQDSAIDANGLGLTYNASVLELCMRVVHMAKALLRMIAKADLAESRDGFGRETEKDIAKGLESLMKVLEETKPHPSLVQAVAKTGEI